MAQIDQIYQVAENECVSRYTWEQNEGVSGCDEDLPPQQIHMDMELSPSTSDRQPVIKTAKLQPRSLHVQSSFILGQEA